MQGNGQAVILGPNSVNILLNTAVFLGKHQKIISGLTSLRNGYFNVDLTYEGASVFHIGNTRVNYSITTQGELNIVTYTLFVGDCFCDPDYIDEKLSSLFIPSLLFVPDGLGPNLERFGGTPYRYIPTTVQFLFPKKYD